MTELEKFQKINSCETHEELAQAILDIAENGIIQGRSQDFDAANTASRVPFVIAGLISPNYLTRSYGIRQQALYISLYSPIRLQMESKESDLLSGEFSDK